MDRPDPLDGLAPALPWEPDWANVLRRAGVPRRRSSLVTKRRVFFALAALAAVLVPLAAVSAANDWWFLNLPGPVPKPVSAPVVVQEGEWSGKPWQLVAFRSGTDGVCLSVTPRGSEAHGEGGAMECTQVEGVPRTADTKSGTTSITYLANGTDRLLPAYIVGPVVDRATTVEISFSTGAVLRVPTFGAPSWLGHIRFYATQMPPDLAPLVKPGFPHILERLTGLDDDGHVVACLVPAKARGNGSPLSDCS